MERKITGKQLAVGARGLRTANLNDGILSADQAGRSKIAPGFFDAATANDKFADGAFDAEFCATKIADGAIPLSKLEKSPTQVLSISDKSKFVTSPTNGDDADTGLTVIGAPITGTYVSVLVDGLMRRVADGMLDLHVSDCYFTSSDGSNIRELGRVAAGDRLYWNGVTAKMDLSTTSRVDFFYLS